MINWRIIPGITTYSQGIEIMEHHLNALHENLHHETVIFLEHEDIYTAGTNYKAEELKNPSNIEVIYTGRGGKFTYHGPGQRVIYPIINLNLPNRVKDIKKYIQDLEEVVIRSLADFEIKAFTKNNMIGIWVEEQNLHKKIAAIGVRVKKWITYHGIAINISTELEKFNGIIPCGIAEYGVTSMKKLGINIELEEFDKVFQKHFEKVFEA